MQYKSGSTPGRRAGLKRRTETIELLKKELPAERTPVMRERPVPREAGRDAGGD
jgi:hypothetical protein